MNLGLQTFHLTTFLNVGYWIIFSTIISGFVVVVHKKYFFTKKIDLALSSPTGVGLGAADRKIRDLHVRGFCHSSSEYISNGSESESKQMEFKHGGFIVSNNLKYSNLRSQENNL